MPCGSLSLICYFACIERQAARFLFFVFVKSYIVFQYSPKAAFAICGFSLYLFPISPPLRYPHSKRGPNPLGLCPSSFGRTLLFQRATITLTSENDFLIWCIT